MEDLLHGRYAGPPLQAVRNIDGGMADVIGLGWVGILGVSTRFVDATAGLTGLKVVPLTLVGGPSGYFVIGSDLLAPPLDYAAMTEVERIGTFVKMQGFVIPDDGTVGDFAALPDLLVLMCSDRAAVNLADANLTNLRLTPGAEARLTFPEDRLAALRDDRSRDIQRR